MSRMKEKYHFALANEVNVWPLPSRTSEMWEDVVRWCCQMMELEGLTINVYLRDEYSEIKCCGDSEQVSDTEYNIRIFTGQSLRDFVATLTHEMVHVEQWVNNEWSGDGEKEAEKRQYELADMYWKGWE